VRGADSRVGGLTVDCNTRTHEGALQSEAPLSAQRWYASGAVFMQLGKAMRARGGKCGGVQTVPVCCREADSKKRFSFSFRRLLVGCLAVDRPAPPPPIAGTPIVDVDHVSARVA
jgi:hypothetical protein